MESESINSDKAEDDLFSSLVEFASYAGFQFDVSVCDVLC